MTHQSDNQGNIFGADPQFQDSQPPTAVDNVADAPETRDEQDRLNTSEVPATGSIAASSAPSLQQHGDQPVGTDYSFKDDDGVAVRELAKSVLLGIIGFVLLCVGVRATQELPGWCDEFGLFVTMLPFYLFMMLAGALFVPGVKAVWQAIRPSK